MNLQKSNIFSSQTPSTKEETPLKQVTKEETPLKQVTKEETSIKQVTKQETPVKQITNEVCAFNSIIYIFIDICFTAIIKRFGRR
jgi:hypothetical protein